MPRMLVYRWVFRRKLYREDFLSAIDLVCIYTAEFEKSSQNFSKSFNPGSDLTVTVFSTLSVFEYSLVLRTGKISYKPEKRNSKIRLYE